MATKSFSNPPTAHPNSPAPTGKPMPYKTKVGGVAGGSGSQAPSGGTYRPGIPGAPTPYAGTTTGNSGGYRPTPSAARIANRQAELDLRAQTLRTKTKRNRALRPISQAFSANKD